jgi:raffinose/stachyose/melibiose transport system permease protein
MNNSMGSTRPIGDITTVLDLVSRNAQDDFFFPLVFITTDRLKTLPQGLTVFMGEFNTDWGVLFAGLTLSALPITLCYIVLSRQFIAGLTQGAVK